MKPRWSRGLSEKDEKEFKGDYLASHPVRQRLVQMLQEDIEKNLTLMREAASKNDVTNLTEFYADCLATQRTLTEVINLIRE